MREDSTIFQFLQRGSLDGVWYWDLEQPENEWMSPEFWRLLGFDPAEKKHRASEWQDLIHPDDLRVALRNFEKHCVDPSQPYDQVVRYQHRDGSTVWVRCRGLAIRDATGKAVRMLGAHSDLTPQKRVELELEQANRELKDALATIKTLQGLLPMCSHCKRVKDDDGEWETVEAFISTHSDARVSHGLCPRCISIYFPDDGRDPDEPPK